ncbi:MAG: phage minor capsid protein [Methanothrix sp.]
MVFIFKRNTPQLAARGCAAAVSLLSTRKKAVDIDKINKSNREENIKRLKAKGYDLVRLSSHSDSCPKCQPWEGRTFSLSGRDKEFPPFDTALAGGIFHPGCLHVISLAPEEKDRSLSVLKGEKGEEARLRPASPQSWSSRGPAGMRPGRRGCSQESD